jgi:hypothetical protein
MREQKHGRTQGGRGPGPAAVVMAVVVFGLTAGAGGKGCFGKDEPPEPAAVVEITNPDNLQLDPGLGGLINNYYQAVDKKDPATACGLRDECSDTDKDSMVNHYGITLLEITALWSVADQASFEAVGVETHLDGKKTGWKTYLVVAREDAGWKIRELGDSPSPAPAATKPLEPDEVITAYYQALDQKDAERFCELRTDCADRFKHSLMRHERMALEKSEVKSRDANAAVVYTESLESFSDGKQARWKQDWWLENVKGQWKISRTGNVELTEIGPEGEAAKDSPEAVVKGYYLALDKRDVAGACALRTECSAKNKDNIRNHKHISLIKSTVSASGDNKATVHTESVEVNDDGSRWRWEQDWFLVTKGGKWLIETTDNAVFKKESSRNE